MSGNTISECPTQVQLMQLLDACDPIDETISSHVATCLDCQRELDHLTDSKELSFYRRHSDDQSDATQYLAPPIVEGDLGSLNEFAIERKIGTGGMGVVFQGRDDRLGRQIAVKLLSRRTGPESDSRFVRESKAAAKLNHDHIVPVYSAGRTDDGIPYLVMQLIEGPSLKARIAAGPIPNREAVDLVRQIALGLEAAHKNELIHRDVKPGNILIDKNDSRAKLTDFGLARAVDDKTLTQANVVSGTPQYMSPEQISNPRTQDPRSDIYSLGITLYECLTGTSPFRGQPIQILEQHRHIEPLRPSRLDNSIAADLENICLMAIAKEPDRRYQTASQFADDLQRYLNGQPVVARETTRWEKFQMWRRRNRGISTLTAAVFGLLLILGGGSTIAAWYLNSANKTILIEKQKANAAEQLAIKDRSAAISSLETLVNSLYDELTNDAATIKTREKVVTAAIDGLKSITQTSDDPKADRTTFQAYLRIGDLTSMRGADQEAEVNYGKAIEIARLLLKEKTHDPRAKRELAMAISKLGLHHFRRNNLDVANKLSDECQVLLSDVLREHPGDFDALVRTVVQHGYELAMIRQAAPMDPRQVIEYGETALKDVDRLFAVKQNDGMAGEAAHTVHFCVGRAFLESHNPKLADQHFLKSRNYLDIALKQNPANVQLRSASAVLQRAQAMVHGSLGQLEQATESFESAVIAMGKLSAVNPDDVVRRKEFANTKILLAAAYEASGRHEEAIEVCDEALVIFENLLELSPEDLHSLTQITGVRFQKSSSQMSLFRWADANKTLERISSALEAREFGASMAGFVEFYRSSTNAASEAMDWLLGNVTNEKTPTGECIALALAARWDAHSSTSNQLSPATLELTNRLSPEFEGKSFEELLDYIHSLSNVMPVFAAQRKKYEASVYGLLARNCFQSEMANAKQRSDEFLQRALNAVKEMATAGPVAAQEPVLNNPDLKWVRQTSEFQTLWNGIFEKN